MRMRTPGQRWFDSPTDFDRRAGLPPRNESWMTPTRGGPTEYAPPSMSLASSLEALWIEWQWEMDWKRAKGGE